MMNPYENQSLIEDRYQVDVVRTPLTYMHALLVGVGVSIITPVYLSVSWHVRSGTLWVSDITFWLREFTIPVTVGIAVALLGAWLVPSRLTRWLTAYRLLVPFIVLTALFSTMFTLLGYGYLNQPIQLGRIYLTSLSAFHAVIVATAVFLHLACRPRP
ncbi:hypothetical protein [Rhodopirellula bahusiensis]|uniref:Uncharacterized protein n=1 Tax=Rhodopirellula bahusiensis TaxID=2014065 RepID=A0A2G1WBX1_9BACT|nr:hypothetical protein [Rhodopirellula bahusiensis]PHQ36538.1 hypothetical protein CEE69_03940 [Rhodopirellula bahusiensis]